MVVHLIMYLSVIAYSMILQPSGTIWRYKYEMMLSVIVLVICILLQTIEFF